MMVTPSVNSFGQLWAPRKSRLYVGRDVLRSDAPKAEKADAWNRQVIDDVSTISSEAQAKYQAAQQSKLHGSNSVKLSSGQTVGVNLIGEDTGTGGKVIEIHVPGEKEPQRFTISEDTRISFDEKGVPQLFSGGGVSDGGVLRAEGKDEILINFSSAKVEAGDNTTIINFAGEGGEFVSGANTTYLGAYSGAKFTGGYGELTFAGAFENSEINVGSGRGDFSGVFTKSAINGGKLNDSFNGIFNETKTYGSDGNDSFSGLFLNGALIDAGDGDDNINGKFISSEILAGKGDDAIGNFRLTGDNFQEFQFVNSSIDTGEGDNQLRAATLNSAINLGAGDNRAYGIFQGSTLTNPEGNAKITALLSNKTDYAMGKGETDVTLATSVHSDITTGEGKNTVNLGVAENQHYSETVDGAHRSLEHLTWGYSHRGDYAFGEVASNQVNMEKGDAKLSVFTGKNSYTVHARNEEVATGRLDPFTGLPETENQRLAGATENLAADVSSVRTAANVTLSVDLMLQFQAEDNGILGYNAGRGYKAYSYNLGRA